MDASHQFLNHSLDDDLSVNSRWFRNSVAHIIGERYLRETLPFGFMGDLVHAISRMSWHPSIDLACAAAFPLISGIVGRGHKVDGEMGLSLDFLMDALSASGKSEAMKYARRYGQFAAALLPPITVGGNANSQIPTMIPHRTHWGATASIQSLYERIHEYPSGVWFIDEGGTQYKIMADERSTVGADLRAGFKLIWDASEGLTTWEPPTSKAGRAQGVTPIWNLNVSSCWGMTRKEFHKVLASDNLTDGFMSRMVVVALHVYPTKQKPQDRLKQIDATLAKRIAEMLSDAYSLDRLYGQKSAVEIAQHHLKPITLSPEAQQVLAQVDDLVETVKRGIFSDNVDDDYNILNRIPLNAARMATTMTVADKGDVVTGEQMCWSLGFLTRHTVSLLDGLDKGHVGKKATDETLVVLSAWRDLKRDGYKHRNGVPRSKLQYACKGRAAFRNKAERNGKTASALATICIQEMIADGIFRTEESRTEGNVPVDLLCATDHDIWRV